MNYARFFSYLLIGFSFSALAQPRAYISPTIGYHAFAGLGHDLAVRTNYKVGELGLRYNLDERWFLDARTSGVGLTAFDDSERYLESNYQQPVPRYFNGSLMAGYSVVNDSKLTTRSRGANYQNRRLSVRAGYTYFQYSLLDESEPYGGFVVERGTEDGFLHQATGMRTNCLAVGLDYYTSKINQKKKSVWVHHLYADMLMGVDMTTTAIAIDDEPRPQPSYYYYDTDFPVYDYKFDRSRFEAHRFGGGIGYEFTKSILGNWGLTAGVAVVYKPVLILDHINESRIFAPRGFNADRNLPWQVNVRIGLSFIGVKK